jgi:hypothetical protein
MLIVVLLIVVMLSVVLLCVVMLIVILLSVVMLSVVAPLIKAHIYPQSKLSKLATRNKQFVPIPLNWYVILHLPYQSQTNLTKLFFLFGAKIS